MRDWLAGQEEVHRRIAGAFAPRGAASAGAGPFVWTARAVRTQEGADARRGRWRGLTDGMQRLLRMGDWDADAVGDVLRGYVLERLCNDGVLTVHENGCIKQGIPSVGGPGGTPEPAARSTTARSAPLAQVPGVSGVLIDRELPLRGPGPTTAAGPPASTTNVGFAAKSDRAGLQWV